MEAFFYGVIEGIGFWFSTLVIGYGIYLWWKAGHEV